MHPIHVHFEEGVILSRNGQLETLRNYGDWCDCLKTAEDRAVADPVQRGVPERAELRLAPRDEGHFAVDEVENIRADHDEAGEDEAVRTRVALQDVVHRGPGHANQSTRTVFSQNVGFGPRSWYN